jgi:hypothetical protein
VVQYHHNKVGLRNTASEEEWVTKKKVEVTTTKNVERRIKRQLVLEDGRVVEDELPQVTVDTTEDKQTFETDHDEERQVERDLAHVGVGGISKFSTAGGLLVGDKFTSVKKTQDVRENEVRTEAVQNMGDIANRDVEKVFKKNEDIRKFLRKPKNNQQVAVAPRTVYTKKNHRTVTDKEDVSERNWLHNGKMQNERIRTEEHVEYDSDDTPDDGDHSSTSGSSHHQLEPETYKTRKDENFTEYFKVGKRAGGKVERHKIADGPHYVSESKEVERQEDKQVDQKHNQKSRRIREGGRRYLNDNHERPASLHGKPTITHTDSWLERHFGSSNSSLSNSSMDISSQGQHIGGGLRRSASVCDVRPVEGSPNAFYATVKKTGKVSVPKREKREDRDLYIQNRQSAHYSSSGHPIRPPRRKKRSEYEESSHYGTPQRVRRMDGGIVNSNGTPQRQIELQMENHYSQSPSKSRATEKHYSSKQIKYGSEKENLYSAKENHYGVPIKVEKRVENHYVDNPTRSHVRENRYGSQQSLQRSRITQTETQSPPRSNVTEKYYFGNPTTTAKTTRNSHSTNHIQSAGRGYKTHNQEPYIETTTSTKYYREGPEGNSRSQLQRSGRDMYRSTGDIYATQRTTTGDVYATPQSRSTDIYATPHRMDHKITYIEDSPNTKYKTKIVLNASS